MTRRPRRLRRTPTIRKLVQETQLTASDFIYPLFIVDGEDVKREIPSLPDVYHLSLDMLDEEINELLDLGIEHVLLFGVICSELKDEQGSFAYLEDGLVQQAIKRIKAMAPQVTIFTDVCLCEYTSHGHCGLLSDAQSIDNDATLPILARVALSHAEAGADFVAPSDKMDGRVAAIRAILDQNGYEHVGILSYSVKFASNYYGPFREAVGSAPSFGDRKTYQMDYANISESLLEVQLDEQEGADMIMVKPALAYLDMITRIKESSLLPLVAYNVSGEYSMLKMAVQQGMVDEAVIMETVLGIKRAGADIIITYFAKYLAKKLKED